MEARTKLALLEKQEKGLVDQLCAIRAAVRTQRIEVEELVRRIPAPINRLPNELLLWIFELSIHASVLEFPKCDVHRHRKRELAGVSRRWRDVVLHSPSLWTTIKLSPKWSGSFVAAHVARSSQSLVDIEMYFCESITQAFRISVARLVSCHQRWRSLRIPYDSNGIVLSAFLRVTENFTFPSLTHVSVSFRIRPHLMNAFYKFYSRGCPNLENLDFGQTSLSPMDLQTLPVLTSLGFRIRHASVLPFSSLQKISTLSLCGHGDNLQLNPNSLHFPSLNRFICKIFCANVLIRAIVAPNLSHFTYQPRGGHPQNLDDYDTETICSAFPTAHHVVLHQAVLIRAFRLGNSLNPESWPNLESFTICGVNVQLSKSLGGLIAWLDGRQNMQQSKLPVKFIFYEHHRQGSLMSTLYETLHERCALEWGEIYFSPRIVLSSTADGLPWVVRAFLDDVKYVRTDLFSCRKCQKCAALSQTKLAGLLSQTTFDQIQDLHATVVECVSLAIFIPTIQIMALMMVSMTTQTVNLTMIPMTTTFFKLSNQCRRRRENYCNTSLCKAVYFSL